VRRRQPTTALVVLGASAVAIWNTVHGAGPFAGIPLHQSLILLQVYMGVLAGTGLLLAAAIEERTTSERRRAATYAVGEVLGGAPELKEAAPAILRALCENLQWQVGALWLVDRRTERLRCLSAWAGSGERTSGFLSATAETVFESDIGLPGRVWARGRAAWIEDVVRDSNFPRASAARSAGIHGAFAFPICLDDDVLGVIECFSHDVATPDEDLLRTMSTLGHQVGQFIGRKRGEVALLEGQRRTAAILDSALDAVIGMDHHGVITEFNPAAERTFGYDRSEVVGQELADLLIPRGLRASHRGGLARYLATGEGPFIDRRIETTACHAERGEFPVEISITRVPGEDPPRFTGFVRDVTARVQAERERELLLRRESAARREAETANRAKDDFLATLSHELRTPLNAIVGWTRMLLDGTLDARSITRALQVIDRNAHLQVQLVSDILDVSRIITGGLTLDVRPVDLGSVIGAALDSVRPGADAKKLHIRSRLAASARLTEGDPQRLQQIVWNLLANAVKFTPAGGTIDVDLVDAGSDGVRIRVSDNGAGIDPDFLSHVFERFRQADGSVSRQHGGLGLGLAIVRHLVELHGGRARAESGGPGKGSTFTVDLPRVESDRAVPSSRDQQVIGADRPCTDALVGCRVLIVDDEQDARELVAMILTAAGATVYMASSVSEALRHLENSWPDVLLADLGMPGADGFALIREVREREAQGRPHLPAAAVTAYAGNRDRELALAAGFDRHVPKPIDAATVMKVVGSMHQSDREPS
jgi:PAS domain S-box-containing protein